MKTPKRYWRIPSIAVAVTASIVGWGRAIAADPAPQSAQTEIKESRFALPQTDAGLPGDGPIRRYDWFKNLWVERRESFAANAASQREAIVFLGDSITQGWGDDLGGAFPNLKIANRGISGDTTRGVLLRLQEDVLSLKPKAIVLLIGTNDLEERASPATAAANIRQIITEISRHDGSMPILLCEVFPSSATMQRPAAEIKDLNARLAQLAAERPQVRLIKTWSLFANDQGDALPDEFPDLLHPNAKGYAKWAEVLRGPLADLR